MKKPSGAHPSMAPPRLVPGAGAGMPDVYERLVALLARYGSPSMARVAVQQAMASVYKSGAAATGGQFERVVEETMSVFRLFCDDSKRAQLWIDLVELCEGERKRAGR